VVSWDSSLRGVLSFLRRAALDHVFPVAVSLIVTSSEVEFSWITVICSVVERTCLSFWNATNPSAEVNGWMMVLWEGMRLWSVGLGIRETLWSYVQRMVRGCRDKTAYVW